MPQDPVADRLRVAPLTPRLRADAWDAFDQARDADDLATRLAALAMPADVKADLWDLKAGASARSTAPRVASPSQPAAGGLGTFLSRVGDRLNPIPAAQALGRMVIPEAAARALGAEDAEAEQYGPINTLRNMGQSTQQVFEQAKAAYDQGDYGSAAIKSLFGLIPMLGPDFNQMGDALREGRTAEALGDATGLGLSLVAPKVVGQVGAQVGKVLPQPRTAAESAAVQFGRERGVPIDAATATGNRYVQGIQSMADRSPLGSVVAGKAGAAQGTALKRVAGELKDAAAGRPATPVSAGEGVRAALDAKIVKYHGEASAAYAKLRQLEARATPEVVPTGGKTSVQVPTSALDNQGRPITTSVKIDATATQQLAVDLRDAKVALKPILDRLMKKREITGQLMGAEGRAATALDSLINGPKPAHGRGTASAAGPDFAPLSIVDEALGDLKSLARNHDLPELRSSGQGIAAQAVKQLDARVRARAAEAGPHVLEALEDGRAATRAKFATSEARDFISGAGSEPRAVFNRLTASDDAGVAKLRQLQQMTPEEVPQVARAVLDDILERPTSGGGFQFAAKARADWQRLGAETKRVLFPQPGQIDAIDQFFRLAEKIGESPNPSGTALTANSFGQTILAVTSPQTGIPLILGSGALSKILHSPKGVQFLTTGLRMSVNAKPAAQVAAAGQFARAAQEAGVAIPFPKAAEGSREPKR